MAGCSRRDELKRDYAQTLASFMESMLVECDDRRRFPLYAETLARALVANDVSSWDEELCLFTGESALIYYPLVGRGLAYVGGPLGLDAHAYSAYWAGIVRGIEHLVAFRAEAQQIERRTTDLLGQMPGLTRKISDGHLDAEDLALIDHLAAGLSDIFDNLPELRSMAVSTTAFRADFVRRKFDALLRELAVHETFELVNTNVEQLNFFLSYYNDMRLQWQGHAHQQPRHRSGRDRIVYGDLVVSGRHIQRGRSAVQPGSGWLDDHCLGHHLCSRPGYSGSIDTALTKAVQPPVSRRMRKAEQYSAHLAEITEQVEERGLAKRSNVETFERSNVVCHSPASQPINWSGCRRSCSARCCR